MRHILLTWNPGPRNDIEWSPEQWDAQMVAGTANDSGYESRWSVGNRVRGIEPGDRAYLLRQGSHGRGIVAVGRIDSEPFTDESWRAANETAQYVWVTWLAAVPLNDRRDIGELKARIPAFNWDSVYSSGRDITAHGLALEALWAGEPSEGGAFSAAVEGAGFGTAEQNGRIERAAIEHVTEAFQADGFIVTSVEAMRCGWDLTAIKAGVEVHAEVKGVAGGLVRFFLTANEYKTALKDPDWRLVVVTNALTEPTWLELDGPTAVEYAEPSLYQVRVPNELFEA